ncbi:MAG: polymer-forming cytoskeletal protein, partial [Caldilineaceae bacterium]|nr:polymer-forming cytoskeletal protein [Caldilineaceae bacterium]
KWHFRGRRSGRMLFLSMITLLLVGAGVAGTTLPVAATDFRGGADVVLNANEIVDDDLFISGDTVTINGTVKGNLFTSGTVVTVNGHVEGSLFAAGRTIVLNGRTDGSVYVGGYALTVGETAQIGRNLNFGGFTLTTVAGSTIGRSLYGGGYQFLLRGAVDDDVNVGAGALELYGTVGGDVNGTVGVAEDGAAPVFMPQFEGAVAAVTPGLRVDEAATIGGRLNVETTTVATPSQAAPVYSIANPELRWALGEALALLIVGLLFLYLRPTYLQQAGDAAQYRFLPSLGFGFLILAVVVVAAPLVLGLLIALAVVGGWLTFGQLAGDIVGIGLITYVFVLGLFIFTAGVLTKIVVAYTSGRFLVERVQPLEEIRGWRAAFGLILGVIIYIGLRSIPFSIGGIIGFLVTLIGLGALYLAWRGHSHPQPAPAATASRPLEAKPAL